VDPKQPSEIPEFTTSGQFVAQFSVDPNNGGAFRVAAVDDNQNDLNMWTVPIQ
jgi:hypothetical protein